MQEWKIKRMSTDLLKLWLDAIDKLLNHYLRVWSLGEASCPLCFVPKCKDCLWNVMEGKGCEDFAETLYPNLGQIGVSRLRRRLRFKKWKDARIKQLPHWRLIIESELLRRSVRKIIRRRKK